MYRRLLFAVGVGYALFLSPAAAQEGLKLHGYESGVRAYFAGRFAEGRSFLSDVIDIGSVDPRVFYFRGLCSLRLGQETEATADFERGARLELSDPALAAGLGWSLQRVQGTARRKIEAARYAARLAKFRSRSAHQPDQPEPLQGSASIGTATFSTTATVPVKNESETLATSLQPERSVANPGQPSVQPTTPNETVVAMYRELINERPEVLWRMMPSRYQADVMGAHAAFVERMDPEVWGRSFELLSKLTGILDSKRSFVLAHPQLRSALGEEAHRALTENWDHVIGLLTALSAPELADFEKMKQLAPEAFLAGTGAEIFRRSLALAAATGNSEWADLKTRENEIKASLISQEENTATILLELPGQPSRELHAVRIDGKWIDVEMAENWDLDIATLRETLAEFKVDKQQKAELLAILDQIETLLDGVSNARTRDEFDRAADPIAVFLTGLVMHAYALEETPK